ncbi:MAG: DUF502 domain-containing protein [Candidatus Schekmanbacteria bacterium]|nr:DUF502 domain-containing protein [Candidatus Schekmanbacteria bacterium]
MFGTGFRRKLRNMFITGFLAALPLTITYLLLGFLFKRADAIFQPVIINIMEQFAQDGEKITYIPGLGIIVTCIMILIVGFIVNNVMGVKLLKIFESLLERIPLVRSIYTSSKQLIETISLAGINEGAFSKVVMVEYPRKGMFSIGFITNEGIKESKEAAGGETVHVFVPTTPNPTSGMLVILPTRDVIPLSISVEDGIKLIVSAGFVAPHNNKSPQKWENAKEDEIT